MHLSTFPSGNVARETGINAIFIVCPSDASLYFSSSLLVAFLQSPTIP